LILRRMRQRAFVILNPDHARRDSRRKVASKIMICLANAPLVGALVGMLSCCDAMQEEMKPADTMFLGRSNGAGMTVRYLLPRC
jgi:hypothetical protein